jgi:hypothetical protein
VLRNSKCTIRRNFCWKDCFKEINDEDKPKGENDPRNSNSQVVTPQKYCWIS